MKKFLCLIVSIIFIAQSISYAQPISLSGKKSFFIEAGYKLNSRGVMMTSNSAIETKNSPLGILHFESWVNEEFAWSVSAGITGFKTSTDSLSGKYETSSVVPILVGIRYYPSAMSIGDLGRFYFGLSLGQYIGFGSVLNPPTKLSVNEAVFGGQIAAGLDLFITDWFKAGPQISYHFLTDYTKLFSVNKNLSGASFSLNLGIVY